MCLRFFLRSSHGTYDFSDQKAARNFFADTRQAFKDYNGTKWMSEEFKVAERQLQELYRTHRTGIVHGAEKIGAGSHA